MAGQLSIGYLGSTSRHNLVLQDTNQSAVVPGILLDQVTAPTMVNGVTYQPVTVNDNSFFAQQASRPYLNQYPGFGIINQINSASSSSYNVVQITLEEQQLARTQRAVYLCMKPNLDNSSAFNTLPQDSTNLAGDYGNASQDIRNHFAAYLNYDIPHFAHGLKALMNGWEVNSTLKFQSGASVNVLTGADNSGTAGTRTAPPSPSRRSTATALCRATPTCST